MADLRESGSVHREAAQKRLWQAGTLLNEAARELARWAGEATEPSRNSFENEATRYGHTAIAAPTTLSDRTKFAQHIEQRALELLQSAEALEGPPDA